jgi:hypothetical protein
MHVQVEEISEGAGHSPTKGWRRVLRGKRWLKRAIGT